MENKKKGKAVCPENEDVAAYLLNKRQELAQSPKGISENMDMTLSKAYSNICNCKTPIKTLRDLSQIKWAQFLGIFALQLFDLCWLISCFYS